MCRTSSRSAMHAMQPIRRVRSTVRVRHPARNCWLPRVPEGLELLQQRRRLLAMRGWLLLVVGVGCTRVVEEARDDATPATDTGDAAEEGVVTVSDVAPETADAVSDATEEVTAETGTTDASTMTVDSALMDASADATETLAPSSLLATVPSPRAIAVAGGYLYVTSIDFVTKVGALYRVPVAGGVPLKIGGATWPTYVAVDSTHVYWTDLEKEALPLSGAIRRMSLTGSLTETLVKDLDRPNSCSLSGGRAFFAHGYPTGIVMSVPTTGGAPMTIASAEGWAAYASANSTAVCWSRKSLLKVQCAPRGGGATTTVASEGAIAVAVDESHVFYGSGALKRVSLTGGVVLTLDDGHGCATDIALDATNDERLRHVFQVDRPRVQVRRRVGSAIEGRRGRLRFGGHRR